MSDPRVLKLAKLLINYSLGVQTGQQLLIQTSPAAEELTLACYREALEAGAHVMLVNSLPGEQEIFFKNASVAQLEYISPIRKLITETFDAVLHLEAATNTRSLSGVDPEKIAIASRASARLSNIFMERAGRGDLRWCITEYPTNASAQEADMSLADYTEFVYGAGMLNEPDPVALWKEKAEGQKKAVEWLAGHDQVILKGSNIDLRMSIKGRTFINAAGQANFPDGEIFTGPVEDSAQGWVRFRYPGIFSGQEVTDIELRFEQGRVVKEQASKGQELLTSLLNTDAGSRYLGELGIGTNYAIQKFTKNMLFDEKMGGTIHLAVGAAYPETGGKNQSGLHWDMLCDMAQSEVLVDGDVFYKDGKICI